eukprot:SAG31_NODE_13182_length_887_cov_1.157360_2_plen_100_part_01
MQRMKPHARPFTTLLLPASAAPLFAAPSFAGVLLLAVSLALAVGRRFMRHLSLSHHSQWPLLSEGHWLGVREARAHGHAQYAMRAARAERSFPSRPQVAR